ncbi:MAG: alpha/beta fold hydrolase [Bradymonadales bacterium]|nr:alpha/beta fold hydrolase [Bradymonadales bacterium]
MPLLRQIPKQEIVGRWSVGPQTPATVYRFQSPSGRRKLAGLRMALSVFSELSNLGINLLDHAVDFAEQVSFGEKYLPNRLRHYRGQKRLVVLVHGYAQGRAAFETMERLLSTPFFDIFPITAGYQPYSQDIRTSAEQERERIEYILARTDIEEIALVGHSQGGLVIRDIIQRQQFTDRVRHCVFLATPHMGTWAGVAGYLHGAVASVLGTMWKKARIEGESGKQMIPQSAFLRSLNERDLPGGIAYTNLYNYIDPLVWPASYARLPYPQAHNILVLKIGHLQVLYDLQELEIVLRALMLERPEESDFASEVVGVGEVLETRDILGESAQYGEVVATAT